MKKSLCLLVAAFVILCCTGMAIAKDVIINKDIKSITFKKDKNGAEYARVFISDTKVLNGVSYKKDVAVMAFGEQAAKLKSLRKGQKLNVVASEGEYKGNTSYTVIDVVK